MQFYSYTKPVIFSIQVARLERYCQNKGYEIANVCSFDESAYGTDRSEFDTIIDLILAHEEKVVVCCDKVDPTTLIRAFWLGKLRRTQSSFAQYF